MKFFKKREQEQPLILDHVGFVVNGNRRICAYREINEHVDKTKFGHIDVIVLPKCDPKDIDELEAHLQVERDIKQDYSWISLALTLRQKLDSSQYNEEQLCAIFDLDRKEIQGMITELTLAEEYLQSRNKAGRYLELEKAQHAFDQLRRNRAKLTNSPGEQQLFSEIAFRLIESPEGDRLYASIPDAKDVLDDICVALQAEVLGSKIAGHQKQIENTQAEDLFGKTRTAATHDSKYLATFKALRESKEQQAINAVIQNAIAAKKERDRVTRRGNSALEAVRKANTAMADAVSFLPAQTSRTGIREQLQAIEQSIDKIKTWLKH